MSTDAVPGCSLELSSATLSAWRDGALPPVDTQRIEAHIADCPACRNVLAAYDTIAGKLAAIRVSEPVGGYGQSPRSGLAAHRPHYGRHPIRIAGGLRALAAVLVVALRGVGFFGLLHAMPRPSSRPMATATRIATATT